MGHLLARNCILQSRCASAPQHRNLDSSLKVYVLTPQHLSGRLQTTHGSGTSPVQHAAQTLLSTQQCACTTCSQHGMRYDLALRGGISGSGLEHTPHAPLWTLVARCSDNRYAIYNRVRISLILLELSNIWMEINVSFDTSCKKVSIPSMSASLMRLNVLHSQGR